MLRTAVRGVFTIWLAVTLIFLAVRLLPGDPIQAQYGTTIADAEIIAIQEARYGLDRSLPEQYVLFWYQLLQGDAGLSIYSGLPVTDLIAQRLPVTLRLAGGAMLLAIVTGVVAGTIAGVNLRFISTALRTIIQLSFSVPIYWSGTLVLFLVSIEGNSIILPIMVLGFHAGGAIARVVQVSVRDHLSEYFVWTARGRGLPEYRVIARHVLPVAFLPAIHVIALQTGILLSGTVITEYIFLQAGIGQLLLTATLEQDYPVVQGVVILAATGYVVMNTLADWISRLLDPRVGLI